MTHYVYIPGLGDHFTFLRQLALWRWRRQGVDVTLVPMHWSDKTEDYEQKYQRIMKVVSDSGSPEVILVGESAGAPLALLVLHRHAAKVVGIVTICGYNHGAADIIPYRRRRNPALYPLLKGVDSIVPQLTTSQRAAITTLFSTRDRTVTPDHSKIDGARQVELHTRGHMATIVKILVEGVERYIA